jgi:hypothetical protein
MKKVLFVLILMTMSMACATGGNVGNGGNAVALEFIQSAREALQDIHLDRQSFPELASTDLIAILEKAKVLGTNEKLTVNLNNHIQEVAAQNFPKENLILINRKAWKDIEMKALKKALAFHELLGLAGIESTGKYPISQRYLEKVSTAAGLDQNFNCDSKATVYVSDKLAEVDIQKVQVDNLVHQPQSPSYVVHKIFGQSLKAAVQFSKIGFSHEGGVIGNEINYWRSDEKGEDIEAASFSAIDSRLPKRFQISHHRSQKLPNDVTVRFELVCGEKALP